MIHNTLHVELFLQRSDPHLLLLVLLAQKRQANKQFDIQDYYARFVGNPRKLGGESLYNQNCCNTEPRRESGSKKSTCQEQCSPQADFVFGSMYAVESSSLLSG